MHGMRHRVCARYLVTLAGAIGALALPAAAQAGGSSPLHIDPNSPVAKAYALPISAARGAPPESGRSGAIFGAGISTAASAPAPSSDCRAGSGSGHDGGAHCTTTASGGGIPAASTVIAPGGGLGIVWMVIAAVVVLALGLAGGAVLHRRR